MLTMLDPVTALVIVDLQKGLAGYLPPEIFGPVVAHSRALADAFRARELPVVLVVADGVAPGRTDHAGHRGGFPPGFADVVDELDQQPDDMLVRKRTWGAFSHGDLASRLTARGVTQVVITGVATTFGVESTARQAYEAGFNVTLPVDAMVGPDPAAHDHSVAHVFPRLGETCATADVLAMLAPAAAVG